MTTDEFHKLSAVAALLIPHDDAVLTLRSPDRLDVRLCVNAHDADPNAQDCVSVPVEGDVGRLLTDEEARAHGFAERLGLSRTQLYGRLRKYGLDTADT